jgi:hypothetical protein
MEKIINMITRRIHKLDEIIEKRESIFKTAVDESEKAFNAGAYNTLYREVEFLGLLLAEVEEVPSP